VDRHGAGGVQPVVHAFAGSAPALARLAVEQGPGTWLASLAVLRPDLALAPADAVLSTWDDDPWVGAAYSSDRPPPSRWSPVAPFHVCGEHTAGETAALMDGRSQRASAGRSEFSGGAGQAPADDPDHWSDTDRVTS
jgi:hypothetical protein